VTIFWCDDFEGNKLNPKWVATRYSQGGQNNGVWTRDIKDSKIYWKPTSGGTETGWWGEIISLPVSAPGDIRIKAQIRQKRSAGSESRLGIGVNQSAGISVKYGLEMDPTGYAVQYFWGRNNFGQTAWPGFPSKVSNPTPSGDTIIIVTIVRKNGYLFIYGNNKYTGQNAYATSISTVDLVFLVQQADITHEKWIDWIEVTPSSVVL